MHESSRIPCDATPLQRRTQPFSEDKRELNGVPWLSADFSIRSDEFHRPCARQEPPPTFGSEPHARSANGTRIRFNRV
jgi:hypothetical protein